LHNFNIRYDSFDMLHINENNNVKKLRKEKDDSNDKGVKFLRASLKKCILFSLVE